MRRPALLLALLILALLAVPATAGDANVSFQCCQYTPSLVRIQPGQTVTWTGANGATFAQHPLTFPNPAVGNQTDASATTDRTFAAAGVYLWYCGVHGHYDPATNTVSGMSGRVVVTTNTPPTASFTASATDVPTGTEIRFDGTGSSDPDFANGQSLNYSWDLDGDGQDDPGQSSPTPSMVYTNTGSAPRQVTVRLTVTDTNSDAVGPESGSKTMVITIEPAPGAGGAGGDGTTGGAAGDGGLPVADTTPPKLRITKTTLRRGRLRVKFTSTESVAITATLRSGRRKASISRDFGAAGPHTLVIKVPATLRHRRVTLTLSGTDDSGNGALLTRRLRLR